MPFSLHFPIHKLCFDCSDVVTYWKTEFSCYITVKILCGWFSAEINLKHLTKEIITSTAQFITQVSTVIDSITGFIQRNALLVDTVKLPI